MSRARYHRGKDVYDCPSCAAEDVSMLYEGVFLCADCGEYFDQYDLEFNWEVIRKKAPRRGEDD